MIRDPKIILCIPGNWEYRTEVVLSIAATSRQEYLFAGNILLHNATKDFFEISSSEYDSRMENAFNWASQGALASSLLKAISKHKYVIYITGNGGSLKNASKIMEAGNAFLKAGGLALKVETAGKAFSKEQWDGLIKYPETSKYIKAFVKFIQEKDGTIYSCGMQNFGLPDMFFPLYLEPSMTVELLKTFCLYQLLERPKIEMEQSSSITMGEKHFNITLKECHLYAKDDIYYNPYGMFHFKTE